MTSCNRFKINRLGCRRCLDTPCLLLHPMMCVHSHTARPAIRNYLQCQRDTAAAGCPSYDCSAARPAVLGIFREILTKARHGSMHPWLTAVSASVGVQSPRPCQRAGPQVFAAAHESSSQIVHASGSGEYPGLAQRPTISAVQSRLC